jgi:hypothetical protein
VLALVVLTSPSQYQPSLHPPLDLTCSSTTSRTSGSHRRCHLSERSTGRGAASARVGELLHATEELPSPSLGRPTSLHPRPNRRRRLLLSTGESRPPALSVPLSNAHRDAGRRSSRALHGQPATLAHADGPRLGPSPLPFYFSSTTAIWIFCWAGPKTKPPHGPEISRPIKFI